MQEYQHCLKLLWLRLFYLTGFPSQDDGKEKILLISSRSLKIILKFISEMFIWEMKKSDALTMVYKEALLIYNCINKSIRWIRSFYIQINWDQNSGQSQTFGREWVWIVSINPDLGPLVDVFLPSYQRCPVSFLKKILSGDKM